MVRPLVVSRILWTAVAATLCTSQVMSQGRTAASKQWHPARTADGQPDIQGSWRPDPKLGFGAAYDIEDGAPPDEHVITGGTAQPAPDVVVDPPVPYRPWSRAVRDENKKYAYRPTKLEQIDALSRCFEMGVPRQSFFGGFNVIQARGTVVLLYANSGYFNPRTINLDGRPHVDKKIKLWMGDSVGRWEGNTLVVDVTNLNDHAWYDVVGNFHSSDIHVTERWTLVDANTIEYEVMNDDPRVFTRPWSMKMTYLRDPEAGEQWEAACYEGERDIDVILKRNQDGAPR
jgi:hypothetical protein